MLTKDSAICIRAVDYSETSQIVTFFAKATGKFTAIAKGSKRPKSAFDGPIEVFSFGRIVFSDSNKEKLATLTEFQQQPSLTGLSKNLFALNCASFAVELLSNLTDDYDPHPQLFDGFIDFLRSVNEPRATSDGRRPARRLVRRSFSEDGSLGEGGATISLLILFQFTLLKEVGLMPVLNYCVNCKTRAGGRPARRSGLREGGATRDVFYFSSAANGIVCRDCEAAFPDRVELTTSAAKCLGDLKLVPEADERTLNEIEKLLISHFTYTLGRVPKLAKHILK